MSVSQKFDPVFFYQPFYTRASLAQFIYITFSHTSSPFRFLYISSNNLHFYDFHHYLTSRHTKTAPAFYQSLYDNFHYRKPKTMKLSTSHVPKRPTRGNKIKRISSATKSPQKRLHHTTPIPTLPTRTHITTTQHQRHFSSSPTPTFITHRKTPSRPSFLSTPLSSVPIPLSPFPAAVAPISTHIPLRQMSTENKHIEVGVEAPDTPVDTIFGKITRGEIPVPTVYEDDKCIVINDLNPQAKRHMLLMPRKPITQLSKALEEDEALLGHLMTVARKVAKQEGLEDGYRLVINNGKNGCQSVYHLHIHILGGQELTGSFA